MNELQRFAKMCHELVASEPSWLRSFDAEWVDSEGSAKFRLGGSKSTATVEWSDALGFRINVVGNDIVYYETSRSVETAEQALGRLSSLLCE